MNYLFNRKKRTGLPLFPFAILTFEICLLTYAPAVINKKDKKPTLAAKEVCGFSIRSQTRLARVGQQLASKLSSHTVSLTASSSLRISSWTISFLLWYLMWQQAYLVKCHELQAWITTVARLMVFWLFHINLCNLISINMISYSFTIWNCINI